MAITAVRGADGPGAIRTATRLTGRLSLSAWASDFTTAITFIAITASITPDTVDARRRRSALPDAAAIPIVDSGHLF